MGTTWASVSGTLGVPGRPAQPTATTPEPRVLFISWPCPLDGGSVITGYTLEWKLTSQAWSAATSVAITGAPIYRLSGLTNGTSYDFRVTATNAQGDSTVSPTGTGTPTGTAPVGGGSFALQATAGNGEVDLSWLEPDDGGETDHRIHGAMAFGHAGVQFGAGNHGHRTVGYTVDRPNQRHTVFLSSASNELRGQTARGRTRQARHRPAGPNPGSTNLSRRIPAQT